MTTPTPTPSSWPQRLRAFAILALVAAAGAVAPQLCALIPNPVGQKLCGVVVNVFVSGLTKETASPTPAPAPPTPPLEECAPERRLSTGKCLPP